MKAWGKTSLAVLAAAAVYVGGELSRLHNTYGKYYKLVNGTNWNEPWKVSYKPQETPLDWIRDATLTSSFDSIRCSSVEEDKQLAVWEPYRTKPGNFIEYKVVLPANECSDAVTMYYHLSLSRGSKERAAVAVHPIASGYGQVEQMISEYFTSHGLDAFSIQRPKAGNQLLSDSMKDHEKNIPLINEAIGKVFTQHLRAVQYVSSLPIINKECICNYGTSLGGIVAINLAAAEPELFVASGFSLVGHTGDLLKGKAQSLDFVAKAAAYHPQGLSGLTNALNEGITYQPEDKAKGVDPNRVLMIAAKNDEIFSQESADRLRALMGNPKALYFENGHVSSVLNMPQIQMAMGNFFGERLKESASCSHLAPPFLSQGEDLQKIAELGGTWNTLSYLIQSGAPIMIEKKYAESADMFRTLSAGWIDPATGLKSEPIRFSGEESASAFIAALIGTPQQLSQRTK